MQSKRLATMSSILWLAASSASADTATLSVVVRGSVDAAALRTSVARELETQVVLAATCTAPCLEISVSGGKASVAFTPRDGGSRARIVTLGDDRTQWPTIITLLAGNVVRDEAADVLAGLPEIGPQPVSSGVPAPIDATPPDAPNGEPMLSPQLVPVAPGMVAVLAPVAPRPEGERMLLSVGLVPGLSTDWTHIGRVEHVLSLDLIAGYSGGSSMVTVSGVVDIERGNVWGLQLAGVAALAPRVGGIQVAGVAAVAGEVTGVQLAGTAAVADSVDGLQVGGVAVLARRQGDSQLAGVAAVSNGRAATQFAGVAAVAGSSATVQGAGVAAVARGSSNIQVGGVAAVAGGSSNLQVGGVAAVAGGSSNLQVGGVAVAAGGTANFQIAGVATNASTGNIQIAGVTNVAKSANFQIAGLVNVAGSVRGVQIAPINVARKVDGIQFGLINVGGSADGFSFGLINIVPGGRADLEAAIDSSSLGTLMFRHGGNRWHNVYGVGGHDVDESGPADDVWMYGLGFGPSWNVAHSRVDLEAIGWQVNHGARHSTDVSILGQLRLSVAHGIGPFAIVAGGALNTYISDDHESPLLTERRKPSSGDAMNDKVTVEVWPSAFVGIRM